MLNKAIWLTLETSIVHFRGESSAIYPGGGAHTELEITSCYFNHDSPSENEGPGKLVITFLLFLSFFFFC